MLGWRHNRRNRSKNNRTTAFLGEVKQGPQFLWDSGTGGPTFRRGGREGSLFISLAARGTGLLIRRQVLQRKKGPIEHSSRFVKNSTSLGQPEPPTVASNEATGVVSPGISF